MAQMLAESPDDPTPGSKQIRKYEYMFTKLDRLSTGYKHQALTIVEIVTSLVVRDSQRNCSFILLVFLA